VPRLPKRIGRYEIRELIGEGGHALVYEAYDPDADRLVAIKHLTTEAVQTSLQGLSRFKREARLLAKLDHPHVIKLHGGGEHDGTPYLVIELLKGKTLEDWLKGSPVRSRILDVLLKAGRGLAAAHAAGFIHRDFKPQNVMIGRGRVCVLDFGLAGRDRKRPRGPEEQSVSFMTEPGAIIGTPAYMAAEQHLAGVADARTDQFAYCVTLYEALYGVRPFAGKTVGELLRSISDGVDPRPPAPNILPPAAFRALLAGLSLEPQSRFPSMADLLQQLTPPTEEEQTRRARLPGERDGPTDDEETRRTRLPDLPPVGADSE
jgi:serine/threonine protein kinase